MPWNKTPEDRQHDKATYGSPEYRRNRPLAMQRAGGKCEHHDNGRQCGSTDHVSIDHITPVSQGGTHHLDNLAVKCARHHRQKTAQEGNRSPARRRHKTTTTDPPLQRRTEW